MSSATETEPTRENDPSASSGDASGSIVNSSDAGDGESQLASALGVERWVIFTFLLGAFVVFWFAKNLIVVVWNNFDEPRTEIATAAAAVLALVGAVAAYKRPNVHAFANDVATEYTKVTWPSRDEAWSHTVVVIVVSLVATVILAGFDLAWSSLTNFLYR